MQQENARQAEDDASLSSVALLLEPRVSREESAVRAPPEEKKGLCAEGARGAARSTEGRAKGRAEGRAKGRAEAPGPKPSAGTDQGCLP